MALTAQDMSSMGRLAQLAANPQGVGRDEIYVAVASLYRAQGAYLSDRERSLMGEILQRLSLDVEMAVRIALAERLADDEDAPLDLILMLCDDTVEVARPVIQRSRKLTDSELLRFVAEASVNHQAVVAARPHIGEPVSAILVNSDAESVLVALVRNATARISSTAFETLVEKSRQIESLHEPLAHRGDLPPLLATRLCGWISEALQNHITHNFAAASQKIEPVLKQVRLVVQSEPMNGGQTAGSDSAGKLVEKLSSAGQLKAGFLLRVLHQGQTDLFDLGFARLLDLEPTKFRKVFYDGGPRTVALACRAVGIDRCVFATVFNLSRQARGVRPILTNDQRAEVENIFNVFSKSDAAAKLQTA